MSSRRVAMAFVFQTLRVCLQAGALRLEMRKKCRKVSVCRCLHLVLATDWIVVLQPIGYTADSILGNVGKLLSTAF